MTSLSLGRNFWLFRWGQMGSLMGDQLAFIAISFYILSRTNSASRLSLIYVPSMLIGLVGMLILGPLGDIFNRKLLIIYGNMIKGIIWICIVILLLENRLNIFLLSILYGLSGIGTAIIAAGSSGFLPDLVEDNSVQKAFRLITGSNAVINILGGIGAGAAVVFLGIPVALGLNALSFIFVILMTSAIKLHFNKNKNHNQEADPFFYRWKKDFFDGVRFINQFKPLKIVLGFLFAIQFIIAPMEIAVPFFVKKHLHESSFFLGVLLSVEGVGVVLSTLLIPFFEKYVKKEQLISIGIVLSSVGIFMLGICHDIKFIFIFIVINGAGIAAACIIFNTSLLRIIPESYRSRFFTIVLFAEGLAAPIGLFFVGRAIDFAGITKTFMFMGAGLFCLMLVEFYSKTFRFITEEFR